MGELVFLIQLCLLSQPRRALLRFECVHLRTIFPSRNVRSCWSPKSSSLQRVNPTLNASSHAHGNESGLAPKLLASESHTTPGQPCLETSDLLSPSLSFIPVSSPQFQTIPHLAPSHTLRPSRRPGYFPIPTILPPLYPWCLLNPVVTNPLSESPTVIGIGRRRKITCDHRICDGIEQQMLLAEELRLVGSSLLVIKKRKIEDCGSEGEA